ncbi:hypothetical protein [Sorangium sp. So ce131]|uniref:hypothetical protein n=1 Tax=Sorangium sp. So ce131 TaxID=3133282 RepID=UPI003F618A0E
MEMNVPVLDHPSPRATAHASQRSRLAVLAALVALALLGATGCAAEIHTRAAAPATVRYEEVTVYEEPVVHVAAAPVYIETYPRVYYRGTYVYYVDGRWYYPSRHGWVYYRDEPRALVRYRVDFDQRRAHHHHHHHVRRAPAHHDHVRRAPVHHDHVRRGPVHRAPAARPAVTVRAEATVKAGATVRAGEAARPATPARPTKKHRAERRRHHGEEKRHER